MNKTEARPSTDGSKSAAIRRRTSEIENSLAHPAEEGPAWDRRRAQLERELEVLRAARYAATGSAQC